jgi:hypothetical protein
LFCSNQQRCTSNLSWDNLSNTLSDSSFAGSDSGITNLFDRSINLIANDAGIKLYRYNRTGALACPFIEMS